MVRNATKNIGKFITAGMGAALVDGLVLNPLLQKAGLNVSDDIARLVGGIAGASFVRNKTLKNIFEAEAIVGSFQIGQRLSAGIVGGFGAATANTSNGRIF